MGILFVDYGNFETLDFHKVKVIDIKDVETEVQAIQCCLENAEIVNDWENKLSKHNYKVKLICYL